MVEKAVVGSRGPSSLSAFLKAEPSGPNFPLTPRGSCGRIHLWLNGGTPNAKESRWPMGLFRWIVLVASMAVAAYCALALALNQRREKRKQLPPVRQNPQPPITQDRESFLLFLFDKIHANPSLSLDAVVEAYIKEYNLAVPRHPDEPAMLTMNRAKLQVLEEFGRQHPNYSKEDRGFDTYLTGLRRFVPTLNGLSPNRGN